LIFGFVDYNIKINHYEKDNHNHSICSFWNNDDDGSDDKKSRNKNI